MLTVGERPAVIDVLTLGLVDNLLDIVLHIFNDLVLAHAAYSAMPPTCRGDEPVDPPPDRYSRRATLDSTG